MAAVASDSEERVDNDLEVFDVVDINNEVIGQELRGKVHREGILHRSVHVFLFRDSSRGCEVLLQQRSKLKKVAAGRWDVSVAEHLSPGERYITAAARGLREELTIDVAITRLRKIRDVYLSRQDYPEAGVRDHLFTSTFAMKYEESDGAITPDNLEVQQAKWWPVSDFVDRVAEEPRLFTRWLVIEVQNIDLKQVGKVVLESE